MSRWMCIRLDLLHINLFPHLGKDSARTFLLELRAKGYHPRVIVTDMNQDYTEPLQAVFPTRFITSASFMPCNTGIAVSRRPSGATMNRPTPTSSNCANRWIASFKPKTRRTVEKRYAELMAQRDQLVQAEPRLEPIFDSLARHYPTLVNAYDHPLIPLTNNATERLIRRFDQHYQNFAGL